MNSHRHFDEILSDLIIITVLADTVAPLGAEASVDTATTKFGTGTWKINTTLFQEKK